MPWREFKWCQRLSNLMLKDTQRGISSCIWSTRFIRKWISGDKLMVSKAPKSSPYTFQSIRQGKIYRGKAAKAALCFNPNNSQRWHSIIIWHSPVSYHRPQSQATLSLEIKYLRLIKTPLRCSSLQDSTCFKISIASNSNQYRASSISKVQLHNLI